MFVEMEPWRFSSSMGATWSLKLFYGALFGKSNPGYSLSKTGEINMVCSGHTVPVRYISYPNSNSI